MFQVLDPDELDRFLSAIRRQLREERSPFELAFNHTYQFYAEPMVMFTNTHDQLLVNVPILLRLATQKPLNLYSIDTVPMPFDMETLEGKNNEYTFINNSYPYMALNEHNYIPLTETQLRMCDKMGSTYYCQNSYVLCQRTQHTCESAIYYKMDPVKTEVEKVPACKAPKENTVTEEVYPKRTLIFLLALVSVSFILLIIIGIIGLIFVL